MFGVFFLLLSTIVFDWVGHLRPIGSGIRLDFLFGGLDDAIPFVPVMVIFYLYLYTLMAGSSMFYFALVKYKRGYVLSWSLIYIVVIALIIYAIFPVSVYVWHKDLLANQISGDFWASQVYFIIKDFATSYNCFPSLHAAVCTTCFYTWYEYSQQEHSRMNRAIVVIVFVISVGTILSTLLLKQHYIADEIAGIALGWCVSKLVFRRLRGPMKLMESPMSKKTRKARKSDFKPR